MSTLITRIVEPWNLDADEKAAVAALIPTAADNEYKIPIWPLLDVAGEIIDGRLADSAMLTWITPAEKVDADAVIAKIGAADYDLALAGRWLRLGERTVYTVAQIKALLGI